MTPSPRLLPLAFAVLAVLGAELAPAQERQVTLLGGHATGLLGSEDINRDAFGIALSVLRPEPRFAIGPYRGEVKYELNLMRSRGPGIGEYDADRTTAVGALALYRASRYRDGQGIYAEVGLGLQYSSQASYDMPLHLNTTPTFGIGYRFGAGAHPVELGARYFHVSNGGRRAPNGGQNWIFATVSVAF